MQYLRYIHNMPCAAIICGGSIRPCAAIICGGSLLMTAMRCFHHLRRVAADDGHALLPSSAVVSAAAPGFGLPGFGLPGFGLPGFGLPGFLKIV